jgi:hypothetical protein
MVERMVAEMEKTPSERVSKVLTENELKGG